jgi:hypothetical protein
VLQPAAPGIYHPQVRDDLSQGDILRIFPHIFLRPQLKVARAQTGKGGRQFIKPHDYKIGMETVSLSGGFNAEGEDLLTRCQEASALVIRHDCEIENDRSYCLIALVRSLEAAGMQQEHKAVIRENKNAPYFYLPALAPVLGESYADFRRISCVKPDLIESQNRIASLSDATIELLQTQLVLFFTRRRLNWDSFKEQTTLVSDDSGGLPIH